MSTQIQSPTSLFTIEQVELIRRLRNSGISKEQLVTAFESLDRIDRELGPIYTIPVSLAAHPFTALSLHQMSPAMMQQVAVAANIQRQINQATLLQQQQQQQQTVTQPSKRAHDDSGSDGGSEMVNGNHVTTTSRAHLTNPMSQEEMDEIEDSDEFKEFAAKGDIYCCEEIRQFVAQYNIKQQQVATLSGISQSYVSRYLKGDFHDMSERSRKAIQRWYITFRKNPAAVGPAANAIMLNSPSPVKKFISMDPNSNEFVNYPRRERFVFRPAHLEVLERSFMEDSYPSQEKRDDISRICNASVELPAGRTLGDRERVTAQIVSNWFANKRKEMKKLAREEGIPASQVPLRGRGRPSRFSMYDLHDVVSNGHSLSNGLHHGIEMEMALDMKLSPSSLTGSNSPPTLPHNVITSSMTSSMTPTLSSCAQSGQNPPPNMQIASSSSSGGELDEPCNQQQKASTRGNHHGDKEDCELSNNHGALDLSDADHQSLSLAVEMAAVNQAIIALSGQTPVSSVQSLKTKSE